MALPAPYTQLIVIVRNKANVATGDPLVEVTTFASADAGAALHYQAALTVDTAAVAAQSDSDPTKLTLDALLNVVLSTDDALTQEVIVRQQAARSFAGCIRDRRHGGERARLPAPRSAGAGRADADGAGSITGGGDLTANRSLQLAGDSATPGAAMYYGTDGGGAKGFHALSAGGLADAPSDGTAYARLNAAWVAADGGDAPIQPLSEYWSAVVGLADATSDWYQLAGRSVTSLDPDSVVDWLIRRVNYLVATGQTSAGIQLNASGCAITNVGALLTAIAGALSGLNNIYTGAVSLDFSSGTNAVVPNLAHQDATLVVQLPAPIPGNAGTVLSVAANGSSVALITYDATVSFANSSSDRGHPVVGVADSPAMADVVALIDGFSGFDYFGIPLAADGSASGNDPVESDYPVTCSGSAVVSTTPGVVGTANADIATITAFRGSTVSVNS